MRKRVKDIIQQNFPFGTHPDEKSLLFSFASRNFQPVLTLESFQGHGFHRFSNQKASGPFLLSGHNVEKSLFPVPAGRPTGPSGGESGVYRQAFFLYGYSQKSAHDRLVVPTGGSSISTPSPSPQLIRVGIHIPGQHIGLGQI